MIILHAPAAALVLRIWSADAAHVWMLTLAGFSGLARIKFALSQITIRRRPTGVLCGNPVAARGSARPTRVNFRLQHMYNKSPCQTLETRLKRGWQDRA